MADTVVVTAPDAAIAVLQPTLADAIAAAQLYAAQVAAAQAAVLAAEASVNTSEAVALSAAASAQAAAAAAQAASAGGGISAAVSVLYALPGLSQGLVAWATNGRSIGEGPGSGTGCEVRYTGTTWTRTSTDDPVLT